MHFPPFHYDIPLYMAPPSTEALRRQMRIGTLGAIITPASGNALEEGIWWCADNAIFGGNYIGDEPYLRWLEKRQRFAPWCLFAVAPDVVGDAYATVSRSYPMLRRIRELNFPVALVAQDYMEFCPHWEWENFDALFVGGSTAWKLSPAAANLCRVARSIGKHVHMGRVNSLRRYQIASLIHHAHSVDGTGTTRAPDAVLADILRWRRAARTPALDLDPYRHDPWDGAYDLAVPHQQPEPRANVEPVAERRPRAKARPMARSPLPVHAPVQMRGSALPPPSVQP
ncbi:hypothetical protein [Nonomuraea jabiensis]|uniref:hypothetical protein n=1 Tax=Nonomuraea jabiensis TaxID=882448 RepID=UPI003D752168